MWPFKRNKSSDNEASVPPEVTQYYESERRERVGVAWLLGLVTLLATIAVVFVIFFGGRWTYRKLTHKNNPKPIPTVVNKTPASTPTTPKASSSQSSNTSPTPPATSPAPATTTGPQTSSATTQTPSPSTTTTTPTVAVNGKLANTGPGDVVAIFGFTTIAGTLFYNRRYRHQ